MYQALYRKWRPRVFSDVVGQEHITETLRQQVAAGRLSHAYIFTGTRGTGKTTCARILAKAVNCEHPVNGNPCNECASCRGIDEGSVLDIEELDAASNTGVDNIRVLRDEAVFSPVSVKKRVYIIDEVHMLSMSAFNALLKILEEPPEHLIFILATTEIHKVPATIMSRCQRYSFRRITPADTVGRMMFIADKENISLEKDAAGLLARIADGSMRDALSLLDQCLWDKPVTVERVLSAIGLAGADSTEKLFEFTASGDTAGAIKHLNDLYMDGKDVSSVIEELMEFCRDVLITQIAPGGGDGLLSGNYPEDVLKSAGKRMPAAQFLYMMKVMEESLAAIDKAADRKVMAEMCLMQICDERLSVDIQAIISRVAKLENIAEGGFFAGETVRAKPNDKKTDIAGTAVTERKAAPVPKTTPIPEAPPWDEAPPIPEAPPWDEAPLIPEAPPWNEAPPIPESTAAAVPPDESGEAVGEKKVAMVANSGNLWKDILKTVEPEIDIAPYTFLSDKSHAEGEIDGNALVISTKNFIARTMIEAEPVTTALKKAAEQVIGRPVVVRVTEYKNKPAANTRKLDALKRFDNIKFE